MANGPLTKSRFRFASKTSPVVAPKKLSDASFVNTATPPWPAPEPTYALIFAAAVALKLVPNCESNRLTITALYPLELKNPGVSN